MKCAQFIDGHQVTDLIQVPQQRKLLIATTALNLPAWHTYEAENGDTNALERHILILNWNRLEPGPRTIPGPEASSMPHLSAANPQRQTL